jgi:hypothetical protein
VGGGGGCLGLGFDEEDEEEEEEGKGDAVGKRKRRPARSKRVSFSDFFSWFFGNWEEKKGIRLLYIWI